MAGRRTRTTVGSEQVAKKIGNTKETKRKEIISFSMAMRGAAAPIAISRNERLTFSGPLCRHGRLISCALLPVPLCLFAAEPQTFTINPRLYLFVTRLAQLHMPHLRVNVVFPFCVGHMEHLRPKRAAFGAKVGIQDKGDASLVL